MKLGRNRRNAENQDEVVERIHRPAQESGEEGVPLRAGEALEVAQNRHTREDSSSGSAGLWRRHAMHRVSCKYTLILNECRNYGIRKPHRVKALPG